MTSQTEDSPGARRPCARCGLALPEGHGNTKFHPACYTAHRKEAARRYSAVHREKVTGKPPRRPPDLPADLVVGNLVVPAIALDGQRVSLLALELQRARAEALAIEKAAVSSPGLVSTAVRDHARQISESVNRIYGLLPPVTQRTTDPTTQPSHAQ